MAQVCDLTYVLLLDQLERWSLVEQQAAVVAMAMGAQLDLPTWAETRAAFDKHLDAEFTPAAGDDGAVLRRAVGLAG